MLKWLFRVPPTVGTKWVMRDGNPFDPLYAWVGAVKNGWVKYTYGNENVTLGATRKIRDFRAMYKQVKN